MDPTAPPGNSNDPNNPSGPVTSEPINPPPPPGDTPPPPPGFSATVIDPNDPLVGTSPPSVADPASPIQTGQYVVAGQDATAQAPSVNEPPLPQTMPNLAQPIGQVPPEPIPPAPSFAPPTSGTSPAPDPTPYTPPPSTTPHQQGGSSMIKKLRLTAIVLGVLVLLGAIGALVWFFILGKNSSTPTKIETKDTSAIIEPSTPPIRTQNGFDTLPSLPQGTSSAKTSTPSAQ